MPAGGVQSGSMGAAVGGGAGGGVVGGAVSAGGGGVSAVGGTGNQSRGISGIRAHPALKVRDKISIRGTTICFIFTLFIGSIIACEPNGNKRGGGMKAIHPLPGEKHREILVVLSLVTF